MISKSSACSSYMRGSNGVMYSSGDGYEKVHCPSSAARKSLVMYRAVGSKHADTGPSTVAGAGHGLAGRPAARAGVSVAVLSAVGAHGAGARRSAVGGGGMARRMVAVGTGRGGQHVRGGGVFRGAGGAVGLIR